METFAATSLAESHAVVPALAPSPAGHDASAEVRDNCKRPPPPPETSSSSSPGLAASPLSRTAAPAHPPKRARTAYFLFADDVRAEVQAANPGGNIGVLAKATGQKWASLPEEEKARYQARAAEERERVAKEMEALREAGLLPSPGEGAGGKGEGGSGGSATDPLMTFQYPVARIKKICRLDPEVRGISKEATLMVTKCAELFTHKLGQEVVNVARMQNRRKLLSEDVADVCSHKERFSFLREDMADLIKEQKRISKEAKAARAAAAAGASAGGETLTSYFGTPAAAAATN